MNDTEEEIIYRLYKKGAANFSKFDTLLIESNPGIKERLNELAQIDTKIHEKVVSQLEKSCTPPAKKAAPKRRPAIFALISVPAAACILLFFTFIYNSVKPPVSLGGSVSLFVTPAENPDRFYGRNSTFAENELVNLTFQPEAELEKVRQGVLFSVDSTNESLVYFRFNSLTDSLNQAEPTRIKQTIRLKGNLEYIYFFIVFSEEIFDEQKIIEEVQHIITENPLEPGRLLEKKFKNAPFSYIRLQGPGKK